MRAGIATLAMLLAAPGSDEPFREMPDSGIGFVLENSATPSKHLIETMPGGVAVIDFDNDGLPDLYFTNGAEQPSLGKTGPRFWNRLYRNLGNWRFEDVTERAGVRGEGYSMGVAAGDFDNDGFTDLYVVGVNRNILYRNRGDGTFEDVTRKAGVANQQRWSVAAGWFDYDNDGRLDLFVVNYVRWDPASEPACLSGSHRSYCHPKFYEGLANTLYHNNGDGTFTDVSAATGIAALTGKGMGVAFADFDGDGRMDVFVTNDTVPNFLLHNEGGRFRDVGFPAGVAMNDDGRALSSMGVDFRDLDNDGRPDAFVTALANETFPVYLNLGRSLFSDATYQLKVGVSTLALSGWGAGAYDFDNDGFKDLFAACGDVQDNTELYSSRKSRQPNLLLIRTGQGYKPAAFGTPALHRGAAFADFDGDGRVDAVVTRIGDRPLLLRNTLGAGRHWIELRLEGTLSNRDGVGALVHATTAHGEQWNHVTTSVGYASSSDRRVHFGLGAATSATVEIRWPSGVVQKVGAVAADQTTRIVEPATPSR